MYYLLRTLQILSLIIICAVIVYQFSMLKSTANQIKYQQTERFSYSLTKEIDTLIKRPPLSVDRKTNLPACSFRLIDQIVSLVFSSFIVIP